MAEKVKIRPKFTCPKISLGQDSPSVTLNKKKTIKQTNKQTKQNKKNPMSQSLWQIGRADSKCFFFFFTLFPLSRSASLSQSQPLTNMKYRT